MRKFWLKGGQMTAADYVERAAWLSRELTRFRSRGPGDLENAMRGIEREYGIDYWILWRLRYRVSQIRDIGASVFARLEASYQAEIDRQRDKLAHQIAIAKATMPDDPVVLAAADVVAATARSAPETTRIPPNVAGGDEDESG